MIEYVKMSFRNIMRRKRRTGLTVIGIFIGIAAVVSLVSLGQGLQTSIQQEFESIGGNKLFINPGGNQFQSQTAGSATLDQSDLAAVRSVKSVESAGGAIFMSTGVSYNDQLRYLPVIGIPAGHEQQLVLESWAMEIESGRMVRENDRYNIVVGSRIANRVFSEEPGIRSKLEVNGQEYRIVGVLAPTGDPSIDTAVILTLDSAREAMDRNEGYDWIFASVEEGTEVKEAEEDVNTALRNERNVKKGSEDFTVSTQEDLLESFNSILSVVSGVVVGIASISLFVGAVGIMNTMYTSVSQRTREIGVMRAIGAQTQQIMFIFLLESAAIGFLGGLLGLLFGSALSWIGAYGVSQAASLNISPYLGPKLLIGSLLFSTILGIVSGVLPAKRAAALEPAEALRYE
ncbi:FtsX-like permease family protein [Candidatus Nanohaloarchaea archaeon]|nr:FtsX-like permease family protein [Candidatus Nanohaloarchaea archaeon]